MGQTYILGFSACKTWLISAEEPLQKWLDFFAHLLGLSCSDGIPFGMETDTIHCRAGSRDDFHPYTFLTEACRDAEEERLYRFQTMQIRRYPQGIIADVDDSGGLAFQIVSMWYLLYPAYRDVLERGGIPVHAALVEKDGEAYLIAGSSGKGKSTCCQRIGDGWRCHCDDESLVVPDTDGYRVHPMPTWSNYIFGGSGEKTWQSMRSFPLRGIFYLDQAETDEVSLFPNDAFKAAFLNDAVLQFWHRYANFFHATLRKKLHSMIFRNACSIAAVVPAYRLAATIDGRFWKAMENALGSDDRTGKAI
ncbi:MAG: SynChlorMet cassette protein ScmC [Chlorobium limicola]|uniref:SynChlorMet cassette protein ScmC n=1 Tax=Chlorobium limicola TaxID=1092 RepID=UPI0023F24DC3|nr:SynChlorMet cassette protein ScmC [Chlorobium limicola]NTV21819.1 SynChlorMet cassette protein ScmC [Chlorobium limicola]